jgi:serine/threonine protein kinase
MISAAYAPDGVFNLDSSAMYALGRVLGQGAYAPVKVGLHRLTGARVAVKNFRKAETATEADRRAVEREIRILQAVRHPHVVRLYEVVRSRNNLLLILELAVSGDLDALIERSGTLSADEAARYTAQVATAVQHCHALGVVHRDLKPPNVLLDANLDAKLTDFGLSAWGVQPGQLLKHPCGTPAYAAPEVISRRAYDGFKSDVWSLGVLLYVMLHRTLPFVDHAAVKAGKYAYDPDRTPPPALHALRSMLTMDPTARASIAGLLATPWLAGHAAATPSRRRYGLTHRDPDPALLAAIEANFGLRGSHVAASLCADAFDHATATYALMEEEEERARTGGAAGPPAVDDSNL